MPLTKDQRLTLIFDALAEAPSAATANEAYRLLCKTINKVEEEYSEVSYSPNAWMEDGRTYPPQEDHAGPAPGLPWVRMYRSKGHRTFISSNGALEVSHLTGAVVFSKPGKDGRGVREIPFRSPPDF